MKMLIRFPKGLKKALTLSYDDGVEQDIRLMDILDQNGIRCTFNLNSGLWTAEDHVWPEGHVHRRLKASQAAALYRNPNHEVANHGEKHLALTDLPPEGILREVMEDRRNLEKMFGKLIRGLAFAYGARSDRVEETLRLRTTGIAYARTVGSTGSFGIPEDFLCWNPTCHHDHPRLMELADEFLAMDTKAARIFYLWGHSYEFEGHNNWHVIERFCEKMARHEEIWYATNIEIADYVTAFRSLRTSADGHIIENPTATDIWVDADGVTVMIPAGKTVTVDM